MAEKRSFGMHPNLLFDVILRQAGTLQKALLEGAMNAIDAGATKCDITLDTHTFTIEDNGRGIQTRQEIEDFFETFGTPHEAGDAVYGRFRMGRGQMMAYGRNIWRSRQFEMDVDIKKTGLDYLLTEHDDVLEGTKISAELYDPIMPSELERIKNELRKFVAWAQIPISLNGEIISKSPAEGKWTYEDENAYYALSLERTQLAVYNLGVLVNHFHAGRFGIGGTVVTKHQIDVNFARNDVQSTCPVFRKIQAHLKKESGQTAKKKTKLTDAERDMLVHDFMAGELPVDEAAKLRVITCVFGRTWQLNKLLQISHKFGGNIVLADRGDQLAETAQNRGIAFAIDHATLERFGVSTPQALLERVKTAAKLTMDNNKRSYGTGYHSLYQMANNLLDDVKVVEREYLKGFVSEDRIALSTKELTVDQTVMLHAISSAAYMISSKMNALNYEDLTFSRRKVHLGKSQTALAWTDGTQNIWFDVEHARLLRNGYRGAYQVALTLLHEMLHTGPDTGTHEHDHAFYQAFHDISGHPSDPVGQVASKMLSTFMAQLRMKGKKISQKLLEKSDSDLAIETAREALEDTDA